jgi:hypothetical protein
VTDVRIYSSSLNIYNSKNDNTIVDADAEIIIINRSTTTTAGIPTYLYICIPIKLNGNANPDGANQLHTIIAKAKKSSKSQIEVENDIIFSLNNFIPNNVPYYSYQASADLIVFAYNNTNSINISNTDLLTLKKLINSASDITNHKQTIQSPATQIKLNKGGISNTDLDNYYFTCTNKDPSSISAGTGFNESLFKGIGITILILLVISIAVLIYMGYKTSRGR